LPLQTLDYASIDFEPPSTTNKLVIQDEEDRYFDDEDEVDLSTSDSKDKDKADTGGLAEGEYDY
jgi:hypothetical protein